MFANGAFDGCTSIPLSLDQMRIAIIGSNGQVAADVVLHLASQPALDLVPLARTRGGSAFLRYNGVPCMHGAITEPSVAKAALRGCDLVANFALASGTPSAALEANETIMRSIFAHSDSSAKIVFFSTLAVRGVYDIHGRKSFNAYGRLKLRNERLFASLAAHYRRRSWILRLGHVAGPNQNISQVMRSELMSPPVVVIDPDRSSNVTHTLAIADVLLAISAGCPGLPGCYDLVNLPQWTWRQVYEMEAAQIGIPVPLDIRAAPKINPANSIGVGSIFRIVHRLGLRDRLMRLASGLPGSTNNLMRAEFLLNRTKAEISQLLQGKVIRNTAAAWPACETHPFPGQSNTEDLFASGKFAAANRAVVQWPADIEIK